MYLVNTYTRYVHVYSGMSKKGEMKINSVFKQFGLF